MKKLFSLFVSMLFIGTIFVQVSYAQLSGTKTIPGDYASISAAITALNSQGVGSGGVTFNVAAGYTETGSGMIITATGTSSNPIVFQKSGSGANPLITAGVGVGTMDGIILLSGTDYIIFNAIDLLDPTTNSTTTTQMEWGYALLKVDGTNGSQNVTISNCTINLQKVNTSSKGIYSANHTTASTTSLTVTAFSGTNSSNKFYSNFISSCYIGINVAGYSDATPYNYFDHFNQIGVQGGNTVRNFGGSSATTYGIYTLYQDSLAVSNNDIAGGTGTTTTQYGIFISTSNNASVLVYNNTVSDTTSTTTSSTYGIALNNAGYSGTDNTVIVKRNTVQGMTSTAATSAALYGFYIYYTTAINIYVDSNKFINNKWGGTTQTATGTIYGMYIYPYTTTPVSGSVQFVTNNYIAGNKRTQSTVGTGTLYGMYIYYGNQTVNAYNNIIENDSLAVTTSTQYYMYVYNYYATTVNYYNNAIRNIYKGNGSTGTLYGFYISNAAYTGTFSFYNNTANNFKGAGNATGAMYGIYNSSSAITKNFYNNSAYSLYANGGGSVYGIYSSGGTTVNIYKNSVYDLRTSTGFAYGLTTASGTTVNLYNNYISDLRCDSINTTLALMGLYISGGTAVNAYYNTVYLNSVSHLPAGNMFGTAGLYVSTTPTVDIRNNNIVNVSTPGTGGGFTVAHYRSSATTSTYSALSNNNNFYAGTPDTNHVIYYDGTNYKRTLMDYKLFFTPIDGNSVTENPPFVNVSTRPYNLHINPAIATQLETNGQTISTPISVTDDYDGNARYPNTGYPINPTYPPTAPDIGADEFGGIPLDVSGPFISYTALPNTPLTTARTLTATISDASGVPTSGIGLPVLYWKINSGTYSSATATSLGSNQYSFTFGAGVTAGDVISYYICAQDLLSPPNVSCSPATGASGFTYNPPAVSTPPTSPSAYTITSGLSGDYTVGLLLFNKVTGRNITFEKVVKRVIKEVWIEEPVSRVQTVKGLEKEVSETSTSINPKGHKELREVDEIVWIPKENGKEYKGDLYVKKNEYPNYSYPLGTDGIYATMTAAIADLNARGVNGPTRFLLNDATYPTETFPLHININNTSLPTATNTVTIKPNTGVIATIAGAAPSTQIFRIRNNYVTIDGSNTTNGTTRDLTIQNTSTTTPQVLVVGSTGTTPITNVTLKNCIFINGVNSSSAVIISDGNSPATAGWFNNITVQNNSFQLSYIALYSIAAISTGNGSGLLITGNNFNTPTSQVRLCRVYVQGVDGATVSNNYMGSDSNGTDASNVTGIWFATGTVNSTISGNSIINMNGYGPPRGIAVSSAYPNANINITGNIISGIKTAYSGPPYGIYVFSTTSGVSVTKNKVSNLLNSSTSGYGARGINIATTTSPANIDIINNMVWNIVATSDASVTYWGIGIAVDATISNVNVYFNSVNLYGTFTGYTSGTGHSAFYTSSGATILNVRDNIFRNSYNNLNSTTDKSYAIYHAGTNSAFTDINYNDYFATDSAGVLGYLSAAITTLPAWQTATGKDLNSVSGEPLYLADTNLYINFSGATPVKDAGQYISTVTTDIDGGMRYNPPDIGADEGTTMPAPLAPGLLLPLNGATGVSLTPLMDWDSLSPVISYRIQINADSTFTAPAAYDSTGITISQVVVPAGKLSQITKYYWRVNATNGSGTSSWSGIRNFTTLALSLPLNLKVYLEGFWNGSTQVSDTTKIYLAASTSPYALVDSQTVVLSSTGTSSPAFTRVSSGNYFIVVKHRNHLETWSATPQAFVAGVPLNYDFTTDSAKAYGNNMKKVGSVWVLIGGDANGDGDISGLDIPLFVTQFGSTGYLSCDFNGDGDVNALDVIIISVNFGIAKIIPSEPTLPPEILNQKRLIKQQELRNMFIKEIKKINNNN